VNSEAGFAYSEAPSRVLRGDGSRSEISASAQAVSAQARRTLRRNPESHAGRGRGLSFQDCAGALLADMRLEDYSPATIRNLAGQLKPFGGWLAGKHIRDLRALTPSKMRAYQAYVRAEPICRATQALRIRAVKRLYGFLAGQGRLLIDPAEGLREPRRRDSLPRPVLTEAEMKRLLTVPDVRRPYGIRNRALLEVLYGSGVRVGELERVAEQDVDLRAQTMQLRHTKGGRPRVVPLGRNATHWLRKYLDEVRPELAKERPSERALFVVSGGRPMRQYLVRQILARNRARAKIRKAVSPHLLRHTCATHLMQAGADVRSIQELLGHVRLSSTAIYTRVAPVDVKATHERYHPGNRRHAAL